MLAPCLKPGDTPDEVQHARVRARDLGIRPGIFPTGPLNTITDVRGVRVGHVTLHIGNSIRTGVTTVLPHAGNLYTQKVVAAVYTGNGFGKLIGSTQVEELGVLESPIVLTNTLSVWRAAEAVADFVLGQAGNERVQSVNVVVGETNDGILNDIRGMHVQKSHVLEALAKASGGQVDEGCVGAGTGTIAFGFKGGIGTSSRAVDLHGANVFLGVLVQTNFDGVLTIDGLPIGKDLDRNLFSADSADGSIMIVVATDAVTDARQLKRIAKRAMLGASRTGSPMANGSGDYAIAFSVPPERDRRIPNRLRLRSDDELTPLFQAAIEATEEAIYNSLTMATNSRGWLGRTIEALPIPLIQESMARHRYH